MTGQPVIRLRLFGRFSAVGDGVPPMPLRIASRKGIALLAYLALHPEHTVSREKLATLLWGDRPDQQARLNLRQCMLSLRNALAPAANNLFILDGDAIGLRMELLGVDALEFQNAASSTEQGGLEHAAGLYSAALLGDLGVESEEFDVWLRATRARFEADFARVLDRLIEQRDAAGQGELAIAAAEKLAAIDPLREDWQRRLLRMLARHRSSNAALSQAKAFTTLLKKELDVGPEAATSALIEQIQRGEIEPAKLEAYLPTEAIDAIEPATNPAAVFSAPILLPDHTVPSVAEKRAVLAPLQPAPPRWQVHPAVSTSLIVFATFTMTVSLMFLVEAYFTPNLMTIWGDQSARARMASALPDHAPIVVLPFESPAGSNTEAIAERVSSDVIDKLARVPNLKVISRLTSREYREQSQDIGAIGKRLGVRFAVHGSVQAEADRLHVNVELIDIGTRLQVWSERFDEDQPDIASASDDIAMKLGRAVQLEVMTFQAARESTGNSPKAEVDQLIAKGFAALLDGQNAEALARAEAPFAEALRREPDRPGAMLGLAAHHTIAAPLVSPEQRQLYMSEANSLLTLVIERQPKWSPPYYYRGQLRAMQADPQGALEQFQKSVALNPSFAPGYAQIGRMLTLLGQPDAAMENIEHARQLSPKDPASPAWDVFAGLAEMERGHDGEALQLITRATKLQPNNPFFHVGLAAVYALKGDWPNADAEAARYRELTPNLSNEQRFLAFSTHVQPKRFATGARLALTNVQ